MNWIEMLESLIDPIYQQLERASFLSDDVRNENRLENSFAYKQGHIYGLFQALRIVKDFVRMIKTDKIFLEMIEKSKPKRPIEQKIIYKNNEKHSYTGNEYYCKCCKCFLGNGFTKQNYCHVCGQKIDWIDEDLIDELKKSKGRMINGIFVKEDDIPQEINK